MGWMEGFPSQGIGTVFRWRTMGWAKDIPLYTYWCWSVTGLLCWRRLGLLME